MALPAKPSLQEIHDEFGPDTRNALTALSLRNFYIKILGAVTGGVSRQSDFGEYGRPDISSFSASTGSVGKLVDFIVGLSDKNGLNAFATLQYSTDVSNPDPSTINDWVTLLSAVALPTVGNNNINDVELPDPSTQYIFRLLYFNAFNDASESDHDFYTTYPIATSSALPTLDTPTMVGVTDNGAGEYVLEWNTTGEPPANFLFRFQTNGGAFDNDNTFEASGRVNWGSGTNPKEGVVQLAGIPDPEDIIGFSVKGQKSGYNDSNYSAVFNYEVPYPLPSVTTLSVDQIGSSSARFRLSLSDVTGEMTAEYRWRFKKSGGGDQFTHTQAGAPAVASDGTYTFVKSGLDADSTYQVWAQAWNQEDLNEVVEGSMVQFDTDALALEPQNFTAVDNVFQHDLSWDDAEAGNPTTDYEIHWFDGSNWNVWDNDISATANTETVSPIPSGVTKYRIRGNFGGTFSDWVESNAI
jgi:hypothetical protein